MSTMFSYICPKCHFARDHCQCAPEPRQLERQGMLLAARGHGSVLAWLLWRQKLTLAQRMVLSEAYRGVTTREMCPAASPGPACKKRVFRGWLRDQGIDSHE